MIHKKWLFLICFRLMATTRIGIVSDIDLCGERELGYRIQIAAESLGWEAVLDERRGCRLKRQKPFDFVIHLIPNNPRMIPKCHNYLAIFDPINCLSEQGELLPFYHKYDGFLLTIAPEENLFRSLKNPSWIPFYPTTQTIPYKKNALNHLTTAIPVWGNRLKSQKFKELYSSLSKTGFFRFYGTKENTAHLTDGYMGLLPFDGASMINALSQHGITLIFHSDVHNQAKIPSARIFEAAAASSVIICDENEFVKTHFKDAVFYVDTEQSSQEIFSQIERHMQEIRQHPEVALEKAKRAHEILEENFSMTSQLLKLKEMNDKKLEEKKWWKKFLPI
jgi:hypothetical protein